MVPNPKEKLPNNNGSRKPKNSTTTNKQQLERFIPEYLKGLVHPYQGDFFYTLHFHKGLIAQLMLEGFLPIASENNVCLPKLHRERCIITLNDATASTLHISKSARKHSKRYHLAINTAFRETVTACRRQHGAHCWLYPPLVRAFETLAAGNGYCGHSHTTGRPIPVRLFSIEVYNSATGTLAAGELGYTVGQWYTSLTGFTVESGAGSVQLAATGRLLADCGFVTWDLGMEMGYKRDLGGRLVERTAWVRHVQRVREIDTVLQLPRGQQQCNCRHLVDGVVSVAAVSNEEVEA